MQIVLGFKKNQKDQPWDDEIDAQPNGNWTLLHSPKIMKTGKTNFGPLYG